jgi:hypothetical protein
MTYNHAFDIAFSLVSQHPTGEDVTADMLRNALQKRLDSMGDDEIMEAAGAPTDTYEVPELPMQRFAFKVIRKVTTWERAWVDIEAPDEDAAQEVTHGMDAPANMEEYNRETEVEFILD